MLNAEPSGLDKYLSENPLMARRPMSGKGFVVKGQFSFTAEYPKAGEISDSYSLIIEFPKNFPKDIPIVTEFGKKIPRNGDYHVNGDGTLCLGSPLRLLVRISKSPTVSGFVEYCLVPYLFAASYKIRNGGKFLFDELDHGLPGMLADYKNMLGLKESKQVCESLRLLGMKKRRANKHICPCSCGIRLGKCRLNFRLRELRQLSNRPWFRSHYCYVKTLIDRHT